MNLIPALFPANLRIFGCRVLTKAFNLLLKPPTVLFVLPVVFFGALCTSHKQGGILSLNDT